MLAKWSIELDDVDVLVGGVYCGAGGGALRARDGEDTSGVIPLDLGDGHGRVEQHRLLVILVTHDLTATVVEADCETRAAGRHISVGAVVPKAQKNWAIFHIAGRGQISAPVQAVKF